MDGNVALGLMLAAAGCAAIYLASPHQRWRGKPWPAHPARWLGAVLLAAGLISLLQTMQAAAASFVLAHWLMLLFVLFPYAGALRASRLAERP